MQHGKIGIRADRKFEFFEIFNQFSILSLSPSLLFNYSIFRIAYPTQQTKIEKIQFIFLSSYFHYTYTKLFDLLKRKIISNIIFEQGFSSISQYPRFMDINI